MTYLAYIVAAYAVAFVVVSGMIAAVVFDLRTQKRRLEHLEREGGGRRSRA